MGSCNYYIYQRPMDDQNIRLETHQETDMPHQRPIGDKLVKPVTNIKYIKISTFKCVQLTMCIGVHF